MIGLIFSKIYNKTKPAIPIMDRRLYQTPYINIINTEKTRITTSSDLKVRFKINKDIETGDADNACAKEFAEESMWDI